MRLGIFWAFLAFGTTAVVAEDVKEKEQIQTLLQEMLENREAFPKGSQQREDLKKLAENLIPLLEKTQSGEGETPDKAPPQEEPAPEKPVSYESITQHYEDLMKDHADLKSRHAELMKNHNDLMEHFTRLKELSENLKEGGAPEKETYENEKGQYEETLQSYREMRNAYQNDKEGYDAKVRTYHDMKKRRQATPTPPTEEGGIDSGA